jgi:hypothetical protein
VHCHSKRKFREQTRADAEAVVVIQINRAFVKDPAKDDLPPEYELPPPYSEAIRSQRLVMYLFK